MRKTASTVTQVHLPSFPSPRFRVPVGVSLGLAATLVALSACGSETGLAGVDGDATDTPTQATPTQAPQTPTSTPAPSDTPTATSTETPAPTQTAPPPATAAPVLLDAADLPGLNAEFSWAVASTGETEPEDLAVCHRFGLLALGADRLEVRTFAPGQPPGADEEPASAVQVVAHFPDRMTARRATAVLRSWRDDCESRSSVQVSDATAVAAGQEAAWYLAASPTDDPDLSNLEAVGFVRAGAVVSVVVMRHQGQDYNYETGQEPLALALPRISPR